MTLEQAKYELVRRYKYLYENSYLILAPFMYEETKEEYEIRLKNELEKYGQIFLKKPLIYLNIGRLDDSVNLLFEEFLLSEKSMEESTLYKFIEIKRNDKDYLEQVKYGLELLKKENAGKTKFLDKIDIWKLLGKTWDYINEQSGDLDNKKNKLRVLDEYYKIARYKNNGKIYTSGRNLNLNDCDSISMILEKNPRAPFRDKKDIGIRKNSFIKTISSAPRYEDNWSVFTEGEKQQIYLEYHDELPWDLEITCCLENEYIKTMIDSRLCRPEGTSPCGKNFIIKENEIFVNVDDELYRYYQMCPHCGYIVNIPKEILSDGIKKRIEDRCDMDDKLFRKMFLYSELFSLDNKSNNGQKRLLKK